MSRAVEHTENLFHPAGAIIEKVAGVDSIAGIQSYLAWLEREGGVFEVILRREKNNRFDRNAVAVWVRTKEARELVHVGYFNRHLARAMAHRIDDRSLRLWVSEARVTGGGDYKFGLEIVVFDRRGGSLRPFQRLSRELHRADERKKHRGQRETLKRLRSAHRRRNDLA